MQKGQLNWADLNGLLAVLVGPAGGILASHDRGAAWPLVMAFAVLGFIIGVMSAKVIGRVAYAYLNRAAVGVGSLVGYALLALAMPVISLAASVLIPALILRRGAA